MIRLGSFRKICRGKQRGTVVLKEATEETDTGINVMRIYVNYKYNLL